MAKSYRPMASDRIWSILPNPLTRVDGSGSPIVRAEMGESELLPSEAALRRLTESISTVAASTGTRPGEG